MVIHVGIGKLKSYKHLRYYFKHYRLRYIHDSLDGFGFGLLCLKKMKKKQNTFCRSKTYDYLLSTEIWLNILCNDGYKLVETS
jgi:hypothetical protein